MSHVLYARESWLLTQQVSGVLLMVKTQQVCDPLVRKGRATCSWLCTQQVSGVLLMVKTQEGQQVRDPLVRKLQKHITKHKVQKHYVARFIYTHTQTHIHTYTHTHTHTRTRTRTRTSTLTHTRTCMHIHTCIWLFFWKKQKGPFYQVLTARDCMHICFLLHVYVFVHEYVCVRKR